jgi:hypothetical protein
MVPKTYYMSKRDLKDLSTANEIDLAVRGRKSGQDISRPVWFVHSRLDVGIEVALK